jgi:multimeric flavodoxin WrbA
MKVVLINGSPRKNGCTNFCINYLVEMFNADGVKTTVLDIPKDISHCTNCRVCKNNKTVCEIDDFLPTASKLIQKSDGLIIGSPIYYFSITSQLQAFMTRLMYSSPKILEHKLCSFFSVSRRTGNTNAFDQMIKIFQMHNSVMVGGTYVNEIYGDNPNELKYDKEGMMSLKFIEKNFVTMLPLIKNAVFYEENKIHTNFISRDFLKMVEKENNER